MTQHIKINKNVQHKIVNIFLPMIFSICFGCSLRRFYEYPQPMFWLKIRKLFFCYAHLTKVLVTISVTHYLVNNFNFTSNRHRKGH